MNDKFKVGDLEIDTLELVKSDIESTKNVIFELEIIIKKRNDELKYWKDKLSLSKKTLEKLTDDEELLEE